LRQNACSWRPAQQPRNVGKTTNGSALVIGSSRSRSSCHVYPLWIISSIHSSQCPTASGNQGMSLQCPPWPTAGSNYWACQQPRNVGKKTSGSALAIGSSRSGSSCHVYPAWVISCCNRTPQGCTQRIPRGTAPGGAVPHRQWKSGKFCEVAPLANSWLQRLGFWEMPTGVEDTDSCQCQSARWQGVGWLAHWLLLADGLWRCVQTPTLRSPPAAVSLYSPRPS